ncbi:isoleucine--tRNA ligase [Candidatus Dependentiae bacterium]|nr:isoleucine--tRNA ligase [Candidatus Dependentiae bacterium]
MGADNNKKNPFQDTLNLPKTDFSIRANAVNKEPEILNRWKDEKLSKTTYSANKGKEKFILHDGPPYANGNIHLGHVLNKVLKDISSKFRRMLGFHVPVKPGWDCHGLPIELKVLKEKGKELNQINNIDSRKLAVKTACRDYANKWIDIQREEFKNLGVMMDWDNPYITMNPGYESEILKAFSKFVEDGYIERKSKTVPWCPSCQTVLATAEIEYKDRKDPSIFVFFDFDFDQAKELFPEVLENNPNMNINLLIWTTTPWTLPLNRAVVLNTKAKYVLLKGDENNAFVVAKELADKVCNHMGIEKIVLAELDSSIFDDKKVNHPFVPYLKVPVILDDSVLLNEGTACVHSAPGCGPEDYILGVKNGLEIFSPLSTDGRYTAGIQPVELEGMSIQDGQIWVLKKLQEKGKLFFKTSIKHSYPHCWRCHKGLIFRATEQWFCNLQKNNLLGNAAKEIDNIKFYPNWGKNRLKSFVENRTEWCISRQRIWGVPIIAVICSDCEHAYLNPEFIRKIAEFVREEGVEFWDRVSIKELVKLKLLPKGFSCPLCDNNNLENFEKEQDILDVWFDSGVSNYAVLKKYEEELGFPADLYLEGSDQHRGWFQSSLLSSMVLNNNIPSKSMVTHGFTVDEKGHKMSKSLGNVIAPDHIIKKFSRDILRLFVAASDYQNDIAISDNILKNVMQSYKKIRNTCRFMLSNLYDFDIQKDSIELENLLYVDQFALNKLYEINQKVLNFYKDYNFVGVFHVLNSYCANDLSSLYLDVCKDRLYTEEPNDILRRSAQTVIYNILDSITRLMAPILSFLAEEVSDFYQKNKNKSIHLQEFIPAINIWEELKEINSTNFEGVLKSRFRIMGSVKSISYPVYMRGVFNILEQLRQIVLKAIEEKRKEQLVKHSLESKVTLYLDPNSEEQKIVDSFIKLLKSRENENRFFKDWFIVSQFEFTDSKQGLDKTEVEWAFVKVEHALGDKCPRCWQWDQTENPEKLCLRCQKVLKKSF